MVRDVLARGAWLLRIGDLLEFEQIVVERRDRFKRAEANVEVAVEALRRCGSGNDQCVAGRGARLGNQPSRERGGAGQADPSPEDVTTM